MDKYSCPACEAKTSEIFYEVKNVPVNSALIIPSREEALGYPTGDIRLGFCSGCGFIFNAAFDPRLIEYSPRYEGTQACSPTYNEFAFQLAKRLVEEHDLQDKDITEIGCGQGEFLKLLCKLGDNRGVGFDPAYRGISAGEESSRQVRIIQDFYSKKYSDLTCDLLICKMTLEHIPEPLEFIKAIKGSLDSSPETTVFFQVPNVNRILDDVAFWDIYYEHCSYFSPDSLTGLFSRAGFRVLNQWTGYDDQYIMIEAKAGNKGDQESLKGEPEISDGESKMNYFAKEYKNKLAEWNKRLHDLAKDGKRPLIWGSGSKGVAFLSTLTAAHEIEYAVDINPNKQGSFMPGTGHEIVAPKFLSTYPLSKIIIMNPIYSGEIRNTMNLIGVKAGIILV